MGCWNRCSSCGSCIRYITKCCQQLVETPRGGGFEYLHGSPASRRRRRKGDPNAWVFNWATLFLGDVNTGTWPSRLRESRIWDSKIWSWILRDSDLRMTALARATSICKRQTPPLVREGAPLQQTRNCPTTIKICSLASDGCSTPR
jgi:hypothetical protein